MPPTDPRTYMVLKKFLCLILIYAAFGGYLYHDKFKVERAHIYRHPSAIVMAYPRYWYPNDFNMDPWEPKPYRERC